MSDPRPHPHPHPRPHRHHGAWSPLAWALAPAKAWAQRGWQVLLATVMLLVLAVSPSVNTPAHRSAVARQVMRATWPHVLWFSLVATLLGVVLIRIVVVTAQSYGLSQYALEMVVRVLVLELLPLMAALFVALRWSLPATAELARALRKAATASAAGSAASTATAINVKARASDGLSRPSAAADPTSNQTHIHAPATTQAQAQVAWLAGQALPRALAGVFAVWLLAAVSGVLGLVMAYLLVYGWTPWGLDAYTHMVGRVFSPAVALIFALKTWAFSLAVAVVPLAGLAAPVVWHNPHALRAMEVQGLVRMTAVLLLVEVVSLMGNYY